MRFRLHITVMIALFTYHSWAQSVKTERLFSGSGTNLSVTESLEYISQLTGIRFAYSTRTIDPKARVTLEFREITLTRLLELFCSQARLEYSLFGNQVLLKKQSQTADRLLLSGLILEHGSKAPIPYATVSIYESNTGCVADINGYFALEVAVGRIHDSLTVSSMGYEPKILSISEFIGMTEKTLHLHTLSYPIPPARISARNFKRVTVGNNRNIPAGSLYMDTNGQQAALYVENEDDMEGNILRINYYLSPRGNTEAPFRIRLYETDSATGSPGRDMLTHIAGLTPKN